MAVLGLSTVCGGAETDSCTNTINRLDRKTETCPTVITDRYGVLSLPEVLPPGEYRVLALRTEAGNPFVQIDDRIKCILKFTVKSGAPKIELVLDAALNR